MSSPFPPGVVTGNIYDKYRTRNPLARRLQNGFLRSCRELLALTGAGSAFEVGTGPGDLASSLGLSRPPGKYLGCDIGVAEVRRARAQLGRFVVAASADRLPIPDASFDLVIVCEVLEHLSDPNKAMLEAARITREWILVSVPWEPVWRVMNILRGAYLAELGNTPGHLQHFSREKVRSLVARHAQIVEVRRPFPWTMILARRPSPRPGAKPARSVAREGGHQESQRPPVTHSSPS